jgi:hypothetical protein
MGTIISDGGSTKKPEKMGPCELPFLLSETESLLDLLQEELPVSTKEWEYAQQHHALKYPDKKRSTETLKSKFQNFYSTPISDVKSPRKQTRASNHLPVIVSRLAFAIRRARRIRERIQRKLDPKSTPEATDTTDENYGLVATENNDSNSSKRKHDTEPCDLLCQKKQAVSRVDVPSLTVATSNVAWTTTSTAIDKYIQYMMIQRGIEREERKAEEKARRLADDARYNQMQPFMQMMLFHMMSTTNTRNNTIAPMYPPMAPTMYPPMVPQTTPNGPTILPLLSAAPTANLPNHQNAASSLSKPVEASNLNASEPVDRNRQKNSSSLVCATKKLTDDDDEEVQVTGVLESSTPTTTPDDDNNESNNNGNDNTNKNASITLEEFVDPLESKLRQQ